MSEGYHPEPEREIRINLNKDQGREGLKPRVAVADDDSSMLKLTARRLRGMGYEVITASNGQELLNALNPGDTVIIDLDMPIMDGMTAIQKMIGNPEFQPLHIVVNSAEMSDERREKLKEWGITTCLEKPYGEKELKSVMDGIFKKPN